MRRDSSGFTLIELLIVISIIGVLAAVLLPQVLAGQDAAYGEADRAQLRTHFQWMTIYQSKHKQMLPTEGGHKFVLAPWTTGVVEHTEENFDRYFTPGTNDPRKAELRKLIEHGEDPFPNLAGTDSTCTHYAGRAKNKLRTAIQSSDEAWMASDNEGVWSLRDGTVNVLFNGGAVRGYSYQDLAERFQLGKFDKNAPIETTGEGSPIPECKNLEL